MKQIPVTILLALLLGGCFGADVQTAWMPPEPARIVNGVEYVSGNWPPHLAAGAKGLSWGNHRAVVEIDQEAVDETAVHVVIPWRRLDSNPAAKAVVVADAESGEAIANAIALIPVNDRGTSDQGEVVFQPNKGSTTYFVYYLPWESTGGYYPKVTYPSTVYQPDASWLESLPNDLPLGKTIRMESVNEFHSFFPMEVPATQTETEAFLASTEQDWMVIPEFGRTPIRTNRHIPYHWTTRDMDVFTTQAYRDESHAFQLGVYAPGTDLQDVRVAFSGFDERLLGSFTCFNCGGTGFTGQPFSTDIHIPKGHLQPLWVGVQIPDDMPAGTYPGVATVSTSNAGSRDVDVVISVIGQTIQNHGYDDPASQSRLTWLNSTTGRDKDFVIEPYQPVQLDGSTLSILGRDVVIGSNGLPAEISGYFTEEMTGLNEVSEPILAQPVDLVVTTASQAQQFSQGQPEFNREGLGRMSWTSSSQSGSFDRHVEGALEYDGMLDLKIRLIAREDATIRNISLPVALQRDAATYLMGLGQKGGKRPASIDWKWKVENHQEGVWMGAVNKGLQYVLRDNNYVRPLNTNFYQNQPLNLPPSWFNGGNGGIRISELKGTVLADNYSGARRMAAGDSLHFNVRFLITPFKPLDTKAHFDTRFVHKYVPVDSVVAWGGTVVNIHHANEINPYINYPFYNLEQAKAYIDEAHAKGIKVKLYDTIRELTYKAYELFPMRSLGEEIFNDGEGGGHSWLQEHLRDSYHSAWHAYRVDDAAILNKGTSRWTNYYIEGLSWLAANQNIDGLYLDDIAFSRETVKRMISVLHAERDEVVIDLHSANQFNPNDGYINSAMLYMEHFPFISRLWFGEYFDYGLDPDYWMTEVSGLPFGLMGEMLQDGGRPYRGMLYGMTARMYGDVDPRPIWKLMNDFGIDESRMLGYWLSNPPVETGNEAIKATAFVREDGVLIALASWLDVDTKISLDLDLEAMGLSENAKWTIPEVKGLQAGAVVGSDRTLTISGDKGLFILIQNN